MADIFKTFNLLLFSSFVFSLKLDPPMTFWKPKTDNKAADKKADDPWDKMSDENIEKAYIKALQDLMFTQDQITKLTATQNRKNKITMIKQQL